MYLLGVEMLHFIPNEAPGYLLRVAPCKVSCSMTKLIYLHGKEYIDICG